uniref:Uncharacterized protein n=1 Tax=Phasianus colchicus TaxID=9054 RepID=A0A669QIE7_PHACC
SAQVPSPQFLGQAFATPGVGAMRVLGNLLPCSHLTYHHLLPNFRMGKHIWKNKESFLGLYKHFLTHGNSPLY